MLAVARAQPGLAVFTLAYLGGFLAFGMVIGSELTVPYAILITILILVVTAVHRRVDLGRGVLWGLSVWGLVHLAGGTIPFSGERTLYNVFLLPGELLRYDQAVHAFGFGFATMACGKVIKGWLPQRRLPLGAVVIVVLAGMGVGALNEIFEFVATLVLEDTNVGGYTNTSWDLVADLVGAMAAAVWLTSRPVAAQAEVEPEPLHTMGGHGPAHHP